MIHKTPTEQCIYQEFKLQFPIPSLREDIEAGLFSNPKSLPSKYFYDETGSQLFDQICELDEYYPTRTETKMLQEHAPEVINIVKPDNIIEFGSGCSNKICFFLNACDEKDMHCRYWAVDVCGEALHSTARKLIGRYPWLNMTILAGDYNGGLGDMSLPKTQGHLALFMGSTIGNFTHKQAVSFLTQIKKLIGKGGRLLIGLDRVKDHEALHAAYNDKQGLTARFNKNILNVLNQRTQADFDLDAFTHRAIYNEEHQQIEMYLVSNKKQQVYFQDLDRHLNLDDGEIIRTEISRKFSDHKIDALCHESGFEIEKHYISDDYYFSLVLGKA